MSKVTEWYPASVTPVRKGLYECIRRENTGMRTRFLRWDGEEWRYWKDAGPLSSEGDYALLASYDGDKWRGLAEKPA